MWWDGYREYERVPEALLLRYRPAELVDALRGRDLTPSQTEGAVRLFTGSEMRERYPGAPSLLPPPLRERLLRHARESDNASERESAETTFAP